MTQAPIRLDIFADPVCPWCLIGKAQLDRALADRPAHPLAITWHPFRLDPTTPPEGRDRAAHLRARLGAGADEAARILADHALALGIALNPSQREPNTLDAHRLMHWAGLEGVQDAVMTGLLAAHWQEARDIGDPATLTHIAAAAGLQPDLIARLLAGDADRDEVQARESHARQRGVTSVPTFILADAHAISGAQPADLWLQVIDEIAPA